MGSRGFFGGGRGGRGWGDHRRSRGGRGGRDWRRGVGAVRVGALCVVGAVSAGAVCIDRGVDLGERGARWWGGGVRLRWRGGHVWRTHEGEGGGLFDLLGLGVGPAYAEEDEDDALDDIYEAFDDTDERENSIIEGDEEFEGLDEELDELEDVLEEEAAEKLEEEEEVVEGEVEEVLAEAEAEGADEIFAESEGGAEKEEEEYVELEDRPESELTEVEKEIVQLRREIRQMEETMALDDEAFFKVFVEERIARVSQLYHDVFKAFEYPDDTTLGDARKFWKDKMDAIRKNDEKHGMRWKKADEEKYNEIYMDEQDPKYQYFRRETLEFMTEVVKHNLDALSEKELGRVMTNVNILREKEGIPKVSDFLLGTRGEEEDEEDGVEVALCSPQTEETVEGFIAAFGKENVWDVGDAIKQRKMNGGKAYRPKKETKGGLFGFLGKKKAEEDDDDDDEDEEEEEEEEDEGEEQEGKMLQSVGGKFIRKKKEESVAAKEEEEEYLGITSPEQIDSLYSQRKHAFKDLESEYCDLVEREVQLEVIRKAQVDLQNLRQTKGAGTPEEEELMDLIEEMQYKFVDGGGENDVVDLLIRSYDGDAQDDDYFIEKATLEPLRKDEEWMVDKEVDAVPEAHLKKYTPHRIMNRLKELSGIIYKVRNETGQIINVDRLPQVYTPPMSKFQSLRSKKEKEYWGPKGKERPKDFFDPRACPDPLLRRMAVLMMEKDGVKKEDYGVEANYYERMAEYESYAAYLIQKEYDIHDNPKVVKQVFPLEDFEDGKFFSDRGKDGEKITPAQARNYPHLRRWLQKFRPNAREHMQDAESEELLHYYGEMDGEGLKKYGKEGTYGKVLTPSLYQPVSDMVGQPTDDWNKRMKKRAREEMYQSALRRKIRQVHELNPCITDNAFIEKIFRVELQKVRDRKDGNGPDSYMTNKRGTRTEEWAKKFCPMAYEEKRYREPTDEQMMALDNWSALDDKMNPELEIAHEQGMSFAQAFNLPKGVGEKLVHMDPYDGEMKGMESGEEADSVLAVNVAKYPDIPTSNPDGTRKSVRQLRLETDAAMEKLVDEELGFLHNVPKWLYPVVYCSMYDRLKLDNIEQVEKLEKAVEKTGLRNVGMDEDGYRVGKPTWISKKEFEANENLVVDNVIVEDLPAGLMNEATIKANISTKAGSRTDKRMVRQDLETLMETGYFEKVKAEPLNLRPLEEGHPAYHNFKELGVVDVVQQGDVCIRLKEKKTGQRLKKIKVEGVFGGRDYKDIEDQLMATYKGKEITGSMVFKAKKQLEKWYGEKFQAHKDPLLGFSVTNIKMGKGADKGVLTAILQEEPAPGVSPNGSTVITDIVDTRRGDNWKPPKIGFFEHRRNKKKYLKDMTLEEKDTLLKIGNHIAVQLFYYMDRGMNPHGPCKMPQLRDAWAKGIIDADTLVYCNGLTFWTPLRNVQTLAPQIRTDDTILATWFQKQFLKGKYKRLKPWRKKWRSPDHEGHDQGYKQILCMQ